MQGMFLPIHKRMWLDSILGISAFDVVSVALSLPNLELYTIVNIHRMGTIH